MEQYVSLSKKCLQACFDKKGRRHGSSTLTATIFHWGKIMTLKTLIPLPVLVAAAMMLPAPAAYAIPITFTTSLSGANEVPAVNTPGAGFATVFLDPTANTLQVNVTFGVLTSPTTAAHIHCCQPLGTALAPPGGRERIS